MHAVDLSHTISEDIPVYPGTLPPKIERANTHEKDGFLEHRLTFYSHTGTHMDAPLHMLPGAPSLSDYEVRQFVGPAMVIDAATLAPGQTLGVEALQPLLPQLAKAEFWLFRFGWSQYWGQPVYFENYPCISPEVAGFAAQSGIKGLGVDTIGVDGIADTEFPIHHILLEKGVLILENLTHLEKLPKGLFTLAALPLKTQNADGAPLRAVALV